MTRFALLATLALAASGCAIPGTVAANVSPPQVRRLDPTGTDLDVELALASTYPIALKARVVDYELWLHGAPVVVGSAAVAADVPASGTALLRLPVLAQITGGLPRGVRAKLKRSSRVPLELRGTVHLRGEDGEDRSATFERSLTARIPAGQ